MAIRDLIVFLVVFGSIPFILARPRIGIYMWAWLSYMNPHRMTWGFAYEFPFALTVALAVFVGLAFTKFRMAIPKTGVTVVWIALILWMCLTTVVALNPELAFSEWSRTIKIQTLALITVLLIHEKKVIQTFAWVVTLSIVFYGAKGGLFILLRGGEGTVYGPMDSFFEDNNALAVTLLMILPLFVFLIGTVKQNVSLVGFSLPAKPLRGLLWSAAGLSMISVLFTHSRGALLTVVAMTALAIVKTKRKGMLIVAVILAIPATVAYLPDEWFARMSTIQTYSEDTSATGRINAWHFAFNLANDRPLVGGGFDTFTRELFFSYAPNPEHYQDSHSIYFEMLGEHGYVGLLLFILLGLMTYRMAGGLRRRILNNDTSKSDDRWIADMCVALQFGIIAYGVGGAFLGLAYFDLYYHLVGLVLILYRQAQMSVIADSDGESPTVQRSTQILSTKRS